MKTLFFLLTLGLSLKAAAGNHACGAQGLVDDTQKKAFGFLTSLPSEFTLGNCAIQLNMCDDKETMDEKNSTVGDLMVTDRYNQMFYVAFDFSRVNTGSTRKVIVNGRRMVHYEFIDRIPDPYSGRTEAYRLEILKSEDLQTIESLHLGVYTTRLRKEYPRLKPRRSYWVICEGSVPLTGPEIQNP